MAIANGTCVSFCNQPKAHYLATSRESRRYAVCGHMHLATLRESKAHFGLHWVRPWDNCGKFYMDRKRIHCWSNASQHIPIYLQYSDRWRVIDFQQSREVNKRFLPHFAFPCSWVRSWDNRGKCHTVGKRSTPVVIQVIPSNSSCKFNSSPF